MTAAGSTAIPLLEHGQERVLDCLGRPEALGEALCHFARVPKTFGHELATLKRELQAVPHAARYRSARRNVAAHPAKHIHWIARIATKHHVPSSGDFVVQDDPRQ